MNNYIQIPSDLLPHITYIGLNRTDAHWKHPRRTCSETILYFVSSGDMYISEDGHPLHLQSGDILLLRHGHEHVGYRTSSCVYYYVHFSDLSYEVVFDPPQDWINEKVRQVLYMTASESPLSGRLYRDMPLVLPALFRIQDISTFYSIVKKLTTAIDYLNIRKPYYKTATSCCIMGILQELSRLWLDSVFADSQMGISHSMYEKTNELIGYLHSHYNEKITGSVIEEQFGMNFDYLNRIFKKRTGTTIFAFLNSLRLDRARQLLTATALPLSEIAAQTGFSDVYYFSRYFKSHTGLSPAAYRRSI